MATETRFHGSCHPHVLLLLTTDIRAAERAESSPNSFRADSAVPGQNANVGSLGKALQSCVGPHDIADISLTLGPRGKPITYVFYECCLPLERHLLGGKV